ncbi:MAG: asparagine synthase-related protein, partial [Erythrobacter sp.]|nr:asparagine synthase-related protein [Erythrobacter sp.]
WGTDCAARLEGEFALIIADRRRGRLFAVRDHMGLVPLYYRKTENRFVIASDLRTLAALSNAPLEPDPLYFAQVMANRWYLPGATPYRGITMAERASWLTYDGARLETGRYWEPPTEVTIRYRTDAEYAEHYREVLIECTRRACQSDRPLAIAVSGGLDSSALFAVANRLEERGALPAPGFTGYTFATVAGSNAYELDHARSAASFVGRDLVEVALFDPDIDWYTNDAQWYRDIPSASNGAMMLSIDAQAYADGARVIINGNGGDEWLQGSFQVYRELAAAGEASRWLAALSADMRDRGGRVALATALRQTIAELAPRPVRRAARRGLNWQRRRSKDAPTWLEPRLWRELEEARVEYEAGLPEDSLAFVKQNLARSPFSDFSKRLMHRQRSRTGIQSRHPMLARSFIEFSARTPLDIKLRGGLTKVVHRQAMTGLLPRDILERRTKANFTNVKIDVQYADYVRREGRARLDRLCDPDGLERLLAVDFASEEGDYWAWEIWGLYAVAAFLYNRNQTFSPQFG